MIIICDLITIVRVVFVIYENDYLGEMWPDNSEYLMAIDESGTSEIKSVKKMLLIGDNNNENRWFALTGVIINKKDMLQIRDSLMNIKLKYWKDGMFCGRRVVFHAADIKHRKNAFSKKFLKNDYDDFLKDLCETLRLLPIKVIGVAIDKYKHIARYINPYDVYEYSLKILLERYAMTIENYSEGSIIFESRSKFLDENVIRSIKNSLSYGTEFMNENNFKKINNDIYCNPKRTDDNKKSYFELELSDLFAYNFLRKRVKGKESKIYDSFISNIVGYPESEGKGIKIIE